MGAGGSSSNKNETTKALDDEETTVKIEIDWHHPKRKLADFFKILSPKPIGRGHFAEVYLGQALQSQAEKGGNCNEADLVAIKAIDRSRTNSDILHREVDTMLRLCTHKNPNIVSLYDAFLTKHTLYLVMEYCSGGELFDHLVKKGPYSEEAASRLCKQLAEVIKYMHSHGVVHRDLKPENCLLSDSSDGALVKVADFGLANIKETAFMTNVCGTWAYCAPEVKRDHVYTKSVDVWSLGVILFILIGGYHPFDPDGEASDRQLESNVRKGRFDFDDPNWNDVSDEVKDLICKMLCVDAATRLTVDQVLAHPWITHKASAESLVTAPEKMKDIVRAKQVVRNRLGAVLHLIAVSRMEHLALKHGILQQEHIDEAHKLHEYHTSSAGGTDNDAADGDSTTEVTEISSENKP